MYETNHEAKRLIERKIREVIDKGDISPSEMCCIKDAYEALYYMTAAETMEDKYGDESYRRSMDHRHEWDDSMRRGRGSDGRYVSRHSVNDRIIASLERELDGAQSEFERKKILDEIARIREMKD